MAKFCGHCGAELDGDDRVCGNCGTPVDERQLGNKQLTIDSKKKMKKILKIVIPLVILVIVAAIALNVVSNFVGNKGLLRKTMNAYKTYDIDALVMLASDVYYYTADDEYAEEYFESAVGDGLDYFESYAGHSYQFSHTINEIYTMSDRKKNLVFDDVEYMSPDFDVDSISEISVADVTVTAKQGRDSVQLDIQVTMTKEGDNWRILYLE